MGRRKRLYPMNLLTELSLNQEMETNIDYENLTADQLAGLNFVLSCLSERNRILIHEYYENYKSRHQIAEQYHLTENRVRQCIAHALRTLNRNRRMFAYIINGYHANVMYLTRQLNEEETIYKQKRESCGSEHLLYQDIYELSFPTRIYRALKINQIHTVRELLIQTCAGCRIRNLGDISKTQIREKLIVEKLLPVHLEVESLPDSLPQLDIEAEIFRKLNSYDI